MQTVAPTDCQPISEIPTKCDTAKKFNFSNCKFVPFNSGEQDIVIYSVDDEGYIYCAPFNSESKFIYSIKHKLSTFWKYFILALK